MKLFSFILRVDEIEGGHALCTTFRNEKGDDPKGIMLDIADFPNEPSPGSCFDVDIVEGKVGEAPVWEMRPSTPMTPEELNQLITKLPDGF